jgi:phosphatidylserine/phosphatidylglycerophosphate/cardiolipin synthase-like enzyme
MKSSDVPIIVDMPRQRSRRPSSAFSSIPQIASETARRTTAFNMRRGDLVVGPIDHGRALADAIATARTSVGLVSPVADDETLRRVADMAGDAIRRGVHVDLLFGALPPDEDAGTLVSTANEIGYRIDKMSGRNRLRTRHLPTGSGASVLIFDDPSSRLVALIGDHQWLSSNNSGIPAIGLTVTQQSICADVARAVSSLWLGRETQDHRWAALGERWNTLATAAEDQAAATEAVLQAGHQTYGSEAELLVDDEISSLDAETPPTARVGGGVADTSGGEGALRGLVLRITGEGATLIAQARAL